MRPSTAETLFLVMELSTSNARHSRVALSITVKTRMWFTERVQSETKSIDHLEFADSVVLSGIPRFSYFFRNAALLGRLYPFFARTFLRI